MSKNQHSCMFLNGHGDLNISWGEDDHNEMVDVILKKMEEGYTFFVVEKKFLGLYKKKSELKGEIAVKQLKSREIVVKDEDLEIFLKKASKAGVSKSSDSEWQVVRSLKRDDVADGREFREDTSLVGVKPAVAG